MQDPYHGCHKKNRNETHKEIDYKRGKRCLFPTNNRAGDQPKGNIWSRDPIILGRGPGCTGKFIQTSNIK